MVGSSDQDHRAGPVFLKPSGEHEWPGGRIKNAHSDSMSLGGAWESAFPSSSQVVFMLPGGGLHLQ